jgi:hypothetical protein
VPEQVVLRADRVVGVLEQCIQRHGTRKPPGTDRSST